MRSIFLVGFMACGKTTVGPLLAAGLGLPFTDLDQLIESKRHLTIAEIIGQQGEEEFRQLETAMLREVIETAPGVIAPGGGAITRSENRVLMATAGTVVWLDAPFDLCWERIRQDKVERPLARNEEGARARYKSRLPLYHEASRRVAVAAEMTPAEIAARIIEVVP